MTIIWSGLLLSSQHYQVDAWPGPALLSHHSTPVSASCSPPDSPPTSTNIEKYFLSRYNLRKNTLTAQRKLIWKEYYFAI